MLSAITTLVTDGRGVSGVRCSNNSPQSSAGEMAKSSDKVSREISINQYSLALKLPFEDSVLTPSQIDETNKASLNS
jgi:hypothetical protein